MGSYGLDLHNTVDLLGFLKRSGYVDEYDFWSSLSSIVVGTTYDHMMDYLTSEGYTGSPHDKFRDFLYTQVGNIGTVQDAASKFYEDSFSGAFQLRDDDGNLITDDDLNIVTD